MNIFHKLDIHYPGTDIRAAAQGSWLGEGGCSLLLPPTLLRPKGTGLWREPSLTLTCGELVGGSQPHLSSAGELIPTDLEAAASPSGAASPQVCTRREGPRAVGGRGPSLRCRRGGGTRGRGSLDSHLQLQALVKEEKAWFQAAWLVSGRFLSSHVGMGRSGPTISKQPPPHPSPGLRHPFPGGRP